QFGEEVFIAASRRAMFGEELAVLAHQVAKGVAVDGRPVPNDVHQIRLFGRGREVFEPETSDHAEVTAPSALVRPQEFPFGLLLRIAAGGDDGSLALAGHVNQFDGTQVIDRQPILARQRPIAAARHVAADPYRVAGATGQSDAVLAIKLDVDIPKGAAPLNAIEAVAVRG